MAKDKKNKVKKRKIKMPPTILPQVFLAILVMSTLAVIGCYKLAHKEEKAILRSGTRGFNAASEQIRENDRLRDQEQAAKNR